MKTESTVEPWTGQVKGNPGRTRAHRSTPVVEWVMTDDWISLPGWFAAEQAANVLRCKGKMYAMFGGGGQPASGGLARVDELEAAPAGKSALWCARPFGPAVNQETTLDEAATLMDEHAVDRLPVVLGRLVIGVVSRDDVMDQLLAATVPRRGDNLAA
jgi:hypothetical protein